jgi:predicted transcriptional regulator
MKKILTYLKQLELSEPESKLYLTLLQTGPISVRELAATSDIKRTTAYLYIDQLIEKGLVMKLVKGSHKQIAANPPESLQHLVEQQVASAEIAQKQFKEVLSLITSKMNTENDNEELEIRYYKGLAGAMKVYEEALSGKSFRLYVNLAELDRLIMPNNLGLDYTLFERAIEKNKDLHIYEIIADAEDSLENFTLDATMNKGRFYYKYMPAKVGLTAPGILLFDNKVAIISGKETLHVYVLYNKDYFENSKKLFDFIWDVLPGAKKEELA